MIIVGVTGNTGAGKSTVSTIIKNNTGALVIDADVLVKELMAPGEAYFNDVVALFGQEILATGKKHKGQIDRSKLAKAMFEDDEKREKLNKLTFKYVGKKTKELILANKEKEFIVLDFPLLYEGGFDKICNCVIGVVADEKTKIARIKERDRITPEQVKARLEIQIDEEKLNENATYIVKNPGDTRYISLVNDVIKLVHKIKKDEEEKKKA
ncbi:MAG: dephospho-CoA kinase [Clostridia bacterium]|nr:dephospho-CoA kinase [Clostridia bacterium]